MVKNRSFGERGTGYTPRTVKKFGRGARWCKRCGDYTAVIQKYDLFVCRRCFREAAVSLGFRKNK